MRTRAQAIKDGDVKVSTAKSLIFFTPVKHGSMEGKVMRPGKTEKKHKTESRRKWEKGNVITDK